MWPFFAKYRWQLLHGSCTIYFLRGVKYSDDSEYACFQVWKGDLQFWECWHGIKKLFEHGNSRLLRNDFVKSLEEVGNVCNQLHHCELVFEGFPASRKKSSYLAAVFRCFLVPSRRMRGTVKGQLLSRGSMRRWPILQEILEFDVACSRRRGGTMAWFALVSKGCVFGRCVYFLLPFGRLWIYRNAVISCVRETATPWRVSANGWLG